MSTDSLRSRQKQLARETILQATADEVVDKGIEGVSLQGVADRAGVSKRTLYNYFDSREALFGAVCDWSDELTVAMGGALAPDGLDGIDEVVRTVWRSWQAQGSVYPAMVAIDAATHEDRISPGRRRRRQAFAEGILDIRPDLGDDALPLASVVHALVSAPVFDRLTGEDGVAVDDAAGLVAWTIDLIRAALERGENPFGYREDNGGQQ